MEKPTKILYVDMDGCVARLKPFTSLNQFLVPGYFVSLIPQRNLISAIKLLRLQGKKIKILSSVCSENAIKEKNEWLDKYMPFIGSADRNFVWETQSKADYADGCFLLDDFSKNLHEWNQKQGIGIKFMNGSNGNFGTWTGLNVDYKQSAEVLAEQLLKIMM